MRRIALLIGICFILPAFGEDVTLDVTPMQINTQSRFVQHKNQNYDLKTTETKLPQSVRYDEGIGKQSKTGTFKKEKQYKNMTLGAQYDTTFSQDDVSQKKKIYSKYQMNDRFSVDTSYSNNATGNINDSFQGSLSVTPEMKINKHMSIQNVLTRNIGAKSNSEEVKLNLEPFKDDRMNFNVGAGQTQYDDGSPIHTRLNVGTQFRF